jgi:hypothetical protein
MEKNQPAKRKTLFDMRDVKRLVFVLAVASTLGFWALFSNKFNLDSFVAASSSEAAITTPPSQAEELLVLEFPPLPTLVPTQQPLNIDLTNAPVPTKIPVSSVPAQSVVINAPQAPTGGNTRFSRSGGGNQSRSSKPAAVTSTGSSQ